MAEVIALYNDKDIVIVQIYSTSSITCGEGQLLENCLTVCGSFVHQIWAYK